MRWLLPWAAVGVLLASGCTLAPAIILENRSGQTIVVHGQDRNRVDVHPRPFRLIDGASRMFAMDEMPSDGVIRITTAKCEYLYARPQAPQEMIDNNKAWLRLQARSDMVLWYAPLDIRRADEATLAARQPKGFPVRPTMSCEPGSEAAPTP